ncbi:glycoside hydrolase family 5 protein [Treponema zuelzerae]|uniref:Glycoside hydrolase family 5 protein n=1 Tax=Teretinema zuelzerae TaxID=156 RepID=A0AAE3EH12_9SPIR|nr:cellulase family glycosylhydrolase [Teretinema zuelzerae]MCD1654467.1 glycoside hydrolase family 5 protein [Teretinema zuelzerae]
MARPNIAAAKKQGIRSSQHALSPGRYQSIGQGDALWNNPANQKRLGALWKEIARRYAGESGVLGSASSTSRSVSGMKQWETLAQNLIDSIRSVNQRHLIFVERAIWLKNGTTAEIEQNLYFPQGLKDPSGQLVYEFHLYDPMPFSHQNASWTSYKGSYAVWPDKTGSRRKINDGPVLPTPIPPLL